PPTSTPLRPLAPPHGRRPRPPAAGARMTPDETAILARYVRALCPQQKFDEYTPDAWHDVLGDIPLDAARAAAASVARRQPFVSPAEIRAAYTAQRENTAADIQGPGLPAAIPDADPDD